MLPDIHIPDIGILGPYAWIDDELPGEISELPDDRNLDIGIFCQYAQISGVHIGYS